MAKLGWRPRDFGRGSVGGGAGLGAAEGVQAGEFEFPGVAAVGRDLDAQLVVVGRKAKAVQGAGNAQGLAADVLGSVAPVFGLAGTPRAVRSGWLTHIYFSPTGG